METTLNRATSGLERAAADLRAYLASPEGRRVRRVLAGALIVAAPVITRLPVFRATKLGRLVGFTGGAALIVSAAKWLREWEPRTD
jgi:hypothetical protein